MNKRKRILLTGIVLLAAAVLLNLVPAGSSVVETYYTYGIYPFISRSQRLLFGWIPFSIGDIIYTLVSAWLLYRIVKVIAMLINKRIDRREILNLFAKFIVLILAVFVSFYLIWGLNYNRQGIDKQFQLSYQQLRPSDYYQMLDISVSQVNKYRQKLSESEILYPTNKEVFARVTGSYKKISSDYSFLKYRSASIKSSIYGWAANYLGFTGYYNPFTGEAQVNTNVPRFIIPSIALHEVAHQIGYGMEDEANFIGFLVGSHSDDPLMEYSSWFDFFLYIQNQVGMMDTAIRRQSLRLLSPEVMADIKELQEFNIAHESNFEPVYRDVYGYYLRFNQQEEGINQYDIVVSRVVAFYKKEGKI